MFELLFLFFIILGFVVMLKMGAVILHLIFLPFQIVGALFMAVIAAPFVLVMVPLLIAGAVAVGLLLFGVIAGTAGGILCGLC